MTHSEWHAVKTDEVLQCLNTSTDGLTTSEAAHRLNEYGANAIPETRRRSPLVMLLRQFTDFMILILLAAAVISGVIGEPQDTIAILVIVLFNAVIGTVQEYRAERAVAALRQMAAPEAQVLRDNKAITLNATELVPGDVVLLAAGNMVPADLRLFDIEELETDESTLTGESHPITKQAEVLNEEKLTLADRINCAYKSSIITRGRGRGVVIATGLETEVGQIAGLLRDESGVKTPLQIRLARFGRYLALAVLAICALVFIAGLLQGQPIMLMFLTAVSLAVAAIPEALPAVVTISLAFGAHKLIKHNALVRNLPAVETLGSVTYICADKTGTLTQNRMSVEKIIIDNKEYSNPMDSDIHHTWQEIGRAMALNNDVIDRDGEPAGEPTELALFESAQRNGFNKNELEIAFPRIALLPFDSKRKEMTTLHQINNPSGQSGTYIAYIKGAPEMVIPQCHKMSSNKSGNSSSFNPEQTLVKAEQLAAQGYRVLAIAKRTFIDRPQTITPEAIEQGLTFLGLIALIDPPRPEVNQAVADCLSAGITPVMITGDHPGTAQAIAQRLGITNDGAKAITGSELDSMSDTQFSHIVDTVRIYARVTPKQKIRIVKALQERGEYVAMTGDGVNDAPALKRAGIGIAMGKRGTDVAREAADMVLLDDNFSTIVHVVEAGRRIFDNIRKFIKYTMSSNAGEIWTLFLAPFLGLPIPLLPIHILWINLVTDGLPGLAFTFEPAESGIMKRPPHPPNEHIFARGMWQYILWVGLLIGGLSLASQAWALSRGVEYWQTIVFTVLTVSQLFHSLAVRSESASLFSIGLFSNRAMLGSVLLTLLLQLTVIYLPIFNDIFHTQPLPLFDLLMCLLISSLVLIAVEIEKWWKRHKTTYQKSY